MGFALQQPKGHADFIEKEFQTLGPSAHWVARLDQTSLQKGAGGRHGPTADSHCFPVPLASAQSWASFCTALGWPLDLVPKKLRAVCVLAPPRPASATSPDCPAKGLSPNFGPLNLFLGPVPPASSQLALPALSKGSRLVRLSCRWFWGSLRHFF